MKGFVLSSVGSDPELIDVPAPTASDGLVVAQVRAAGVNPVDQKMAADPALPVPRVVGNETVVRLGGRRAYAERTVVPYGSIAEQTVVDPTVLVPLPDDLADDAALAVGIAGLAAWMPLSTVARLQPGETVVIVGATGAVGRIAVQVARLLGAGRVVGVGRDPGRLADLAALGVDATVALGGEDDTAALLEATDGGAHVVLDLVFGDPLVTALRATRRGARVVSVGASGDAEVRLPFSVVRGRSLLTYSNQLTDPAPKREAYQRLIEHLRAGDLQVNTHVLPLQSAAEAWELQRQSPGSKLVLTTSADLASGNPGAVPGRPVR
jgi:NADPH2:quinone reductase